MRLEISLAAVPLHAALKYRRNWDKRNVGVQILESFTKHKGTRPSQRYRHYIPISDTSHNVEIPAIIVNEVTSAGYEISDYVAGIATHKDGKRIIKIGKLLKDPQAKKDFANDKSRQGSKNKYTCVISCHPYDIIGMSTGRSWDQQSCMRLGAGNKLNPHYNDGSDGAHKDYLENDVAEGTLVAYAIKNGDTNIREPDARVLIKPFANDAGAIMFRESSVVYGNDIPGFRKTVAMWLRDVNRNVQNGKYRAMVNLYNEFQDQEELMFMGELEYADLSDPDILAKYIANADASIYRKVIHEKPEKDILAVLRAAHTLYTQQVLPDVVGDLFQEVHFEVAVKRLRAVIYGSENNSLAPQVSTSVIMNTFLRRQPSGDRNLPDDVLETLSHYLKYNPDKVLPNSVRAWVSKINPMKLMQPDGSVEARDDRRLDVRAGYKFLEPQALKADKMSNLYAIAVLHAFFENLKAKTEWPPVTPDMVSHAMLDKSDWVAAFQDLGIRGFDQLEAAVKNDYGWLVDRKWRRICDHDLDISVNDLLRSKLVEDLKAGKLSGRSDSAELGEAITELFEYAVEYSGVAARQEHDVNLVAKLASELG